MRQLITRQQTLLVSPCITLWQNRSPLYSIHLWQTSSLSMMRYSQFCVLSNVEQTQPNILVTTSWWENWLLAMRLSKSNSSQEGGYCSRKASSNEVNAWQVCLFQQMSQTAAFSQQILQTKIQIQMQLLLPNCARAQVRTQFWMRRVPKLSFLQVSSIISKRPLSPKRSNSGISVAGLFWSGDWSWVWKVVLFLWKQDSRDSFWWRRCIFSLLRLIGLWGWCASM